MHKGNPNGKILALQDGPSKDDAEQGKPFTGPAGWKLKDWITDAGIELGDVLFADEFDLHHAMPNCQMIIVLGEQAKAFWLPDKPDFKRIGGSIYTAYDGISDRTLKVICSLHPRDVLFNTQLEYRARNDWLKIRSELDAGEFRPPERNHNISPNLTDIEAYYDGLQHDSIVSLDIETWGGSIKCIGFATSARESIVIPTEEYYWVKRTDPLGYDLNYAWDLIRKICEHPCEKVMQNGLFDAWWLLEYNIEVANYVWDTLAMHHALWPRDNHALDYLARLYTKQPYWKDEAKEADEIVRVAKQGMDKLYVYNGLDCTVTWEIREALDKELREAGLLDFYKVHYAEMFNPLLGMMRTGSLVDRQKMNETYNELIADALMLRDEASKLVGKPLFTFDKTKCERDLLALYESWGMGPHDHPQFLSALVAEGHKIETIERKWKELQDKGISDTKLIEVLDELGLPKAAIGSTAKGRMKVDNISLRKVQKYYEDRKTGSSKGDMVRSLVDNVLEHRRKKKLASFLTDKKIDDDSRLRCTYKFTTKTGRLASSKNPYGTGMNLQNIDRELRHMFVASKDRVLLEIDLSRAENRVVGALTGVNYMLEAARRPTTGLDVYEERTAGIYSVMWNREVTIEEVDGEMRRLGKEVVLAVPYGMQGKTFSERIMKKLGITLTPKEASDLLNADLKKQPAIRQWQSEVRKVVMRDRYLQTSWGRSIDFLHDRMDDETYRFAYCYIPQSEIGDLTNNWMIKPLHNIIKEHKLKSELIMQVHDAAIIDAVPEEVWYIMRYVQKCVERPRVYGQSFGRAIELTVPCEFGIGKTWKIKKAHEWKELPSKEEVADTIKEIM